MPTQLFAKTVNAAQTSDITVTASAPVTVSINGDAGLDNLIIERKNSAGGYKPFRVLTDSKPGETITGAGLYRVRKLASTLAFGADQD